MCLIISKPSGVQLDWEAIEKGWTRNSDSIGIMWVQDKKLKIKKFFKLEGIQKTIEHLDASMPMVIHQRFATHGEVSLANAHPFRLSKDLAFCHNGVLLGYGSHKASDTLDYANRVLKPLIQRFGEDCVFNPIIQHLIEGDIVGNKFVFLHSDGRIAIFNKSKGEECGGCWYSNCDYKTPRPLPFAGYQSWGGSSHTTYYQPIQKESPYSWEIDAPEEEVEFIRDLVKRGDIKPEDITEEFGYPVTFLV